MTKKKSTMSAYPPRHLYFKYLIGKEKKHTVQSKLTNYE